MTFLNYSFRCVALWMMLFSISFSTQAQCPSNSNNPWEWPSHRNWLIGAGNDHTSQVFNASTSAITTVGAAGNAITTYEGTAIASDDKGSPLFFTNGRNLWRMGNNVPTFTGLLTGNENGATGVNGSAAQGVIVVKHPLDPSNYYVFTTDDANGGTTLGFNYFIVDKNANLISGPNRLGTYRTMEGIAATKHSNGVDVWISSYESGTANLNAYLLTCAGLVTTPVVSAVAPVIDAANKERGGIVFSWDGTKFAQTHPDFWPNSDKEFTLFDFNSTTGSFSNPVNFSSTADSDMGYDLLFSPNNTKLYFSTQLGKVGYFDLSAGSTAAITASRAFLTIADASTHAAIEIGPDGNLYQASGNPGGGLLRKITGNLNAGGAGAFALTTVSSTVSAKGLPTIYIPPTDKPAIAAVGTLCTTDPPINLSTTWACAGGTAEGGTPVGVYTSNCGACITNSATGAFDPSIAGVGAWQIIFTRCLVADTIDIVVNNCGACPDTSLSNSIPPICSSGTIALNTYKVTVEAGAWSIQSGPAGYSASITGSTFNGNSSAAGYYVIRFTLSTPKVGCPSFAERTVVIKANPTISMADQNICTGDSTAFDAGNAGATFLWSNQGAGTIQTTKAKNAGTYTVAVTVNGCTTSGSATLTLKALPVISMSNQAICAGDSTTFDAGNAGASFVWSNQGAGTNQTTKAKTAGTYTVEVTGLNGCKDTASAVLTVNVLPTPTLNDASVCPGGFIVLQPSPSTYDFYEWSTGVSGASKDTIHYSVPNSTVWVRVTDAKGCSDSAFANITMGDTLHVDFGGPKDVCADQSIVLNAAQYGPFIPVTHYNWTPAAPDQATLSVTSPGTYSVLVEDGRGCQGDAQVEVTIRPLPAVDLHDSSVCFAGKEVINVSVLSGFKTYSWSNGSNLNNTAVLKPGIVKVYVTNNFDCAAADSAMFTDFCEPTQLCFPNVVTPNGDGNNDEFMPCKDDMILINDGNYKSIVNNILHIDLQIYDRWGVRLFQSLNTLPRWDCTYRGNRVSPAVYYYVVRYTDSAHNDCEQTGWVQVLAE